MNSCYDLTVDVCVLMSGSKIGNKDYYQTSSALMKIMKNNKKFKLAIDDRGKIEKQYQGKLKGTWGWSWLELMGSKNKIKSIPWNNIDRGIRVKLSEAGFPFEDEDYKYVVTASGTICKHLVSHDPDYSNKVCKVLKRLKIKVKTACECHEL